MSSSTDERHLRFDAVFNFRDLGGYPTRDGRTTRWRTFYRADGLFRMTEADIDTVRALGLRTVLDLRTPDELTERGTFPVGAHPVRFEHLPFLVNHWDPAEAVDDTTSFLVRKYTEMLDEGSASIAAAFAVLADHDAPPAVFHCAAGKDRTGVLAMLLLAVAGVPDEIIGQDYALTAAGMERMMQWYKDNRIGEEVNVMERPPDAWIASPAEVSPRLLGVIRERHGSVEGFLGSLGVSGATIDAVRHHLID